MYVFSSFRRVSYAETDKMGYLYYGRYADYYETGRVEALRALGFAYREMEESGLIMPVIDMKVHYRKPAFYDDLLEIKTSIPDLPGVRIHFRYEIFNPEKKLINEGETTLVFYNIEKQRPCECPADLLDALRTFY